MTKPDTVKVKYKGRIVVVLHDINPWEFRGYFLGSQGVNFVFRWSEVTRFLEE